MPRFNGTGPQGLGPQTGWGMGPCGGRVGRGNGYGRGGYGRRWTRTEELSVLEDEKQMIAEELEEIKAEIKVLREQK